MASGIYSITCTANGKVYIGSAKSLENRKNDHFSALRGKRHGNRNLQNSYNKYGEDFFVWEIKENCAVEDLIAREQHYIDTLKPRFNLSPTAGSTLGVVCHETTKAKISSAKSGKKHTPEQVEKNREVQTGKLHRHVLTPEDALDIIMRFLAGEDEHDLADRFGINYKSVCSIIKRKSWTTLQLPPEIEAQLPKGDRRTKGLSKAPKGEAHDRSVFTIDQVKNIKGRLDRGDSINVIAAAYGVRTSTITSIKYGHSWSHVTDYPKLNGSPIRLRSKTAV